MSSKTIDDSFSLRSPLKKESNAVKTSWESCGWGRREQFRLKVGSKGDLYVQTVVQGCFKRFLSTILRVISFGKLKSIGKHVKEWRNLGPTSPIKVNFDLTREQRTFLVVRQQANLRISFADLEKKVSAELAELRLLQQNYSSDMVAFKELNEIIDHLTTIESKLEVLKSTIGDAQERFKLFRFFDAQYHFFIKAKEEKYKQWDSNLGKTRLTELEVQKQTTSLQFDILEESLSQHLMMLMQKREEYNTFPELYQRISEMIVRDTGKQTVLSKEVSEEQLSTLRREVDDLIQSDLHSLVEIEREKTRREFETGTSRQKIYGEQIKAGKKLLIQHIEKFQDVAKKYIHDSTPEKEILQIIEERRLILNQEPAHKEEEANGFLKLIWTIIQKDNSRLKEILNTYSLPVFSIKKNYPLFITDNTLPPLWLLMCTAMPSTELTKEALQIQESILEDIKHLLTTMKAHAREARNSGYTGLEREIREIITQLDRKNKEFHTFTQTAPNWNELHLKSLQINSEVHVYLKKLAEIQEIMVNAQTLELLGLDVAKRVHQFARRLPGAVLSDEDVLKIQNEIETLMKLDRSSLTRSEEHFNTILTRQHQLIALCFSVAEKYIKMKNTILNDEFGLLLQTKVHSDSKIQFLQQRRNQEWHALLQRGPACISPDDLTQWAQKVFAQSVVDEALIEELRKGSLGGTLDSVKEIISAIGKEVVAELPVPSCLEEYEKLKSDFDDFVGNKTKSLVQMQALLKQAEENVQLWEQQGFISHDAALKWNQVVSFLQARYACIELLLEYHSSITSQFIDFFEKQRETYLHSGSSPFILNLIDQHVSLMKPFVRWDTTAAISSYDSHYALWNNTLEEAKKVFQQLQMIDENEKAYKKVLNDAQQLIAQCGQNHQFTNQLRIEQEVARQTQQLNEVKRDSFENLLKYEEMLRLFKEKLEEQLILTKDVPYLDQLQFLHETSEQAETLRKVAAEHLTTKVNKHVEILQSAENDLKGLWGTSSSNWQHQILEGLQSKKKAMSECLEKISIAGSSYSQLRELQSNIKQAIKNDRNDLESKTSLSTVLVSKKRYESFISEVEKRIFDLRNDFQYCHADNLNYILQTQMNRCQTLGNKLTSKNRMIAYSNTLEGAIAAIESTLEDINKAGYLSDIEQMKSLKSKNPKDFDKLHQHFRQGLENKIENYTQELNDYQKRISAEIATLQCEMNISQKRELKDVTNVHKFHEMSEKLLQLEVLQAKVVENKSALQKLTDKFPVWTYAIWMGKQPLAVSQLTPDQLKEYEIEVNACIENCRSKLNPLIGILT